MTPIDPKKWLQDRGWKEHNAGTPNSYWRTTPNELGWEGGWTLRGAVHAELEHDNRNTLIAMGLWTPIAKRKRR